MIAIWERVCKKHDITLTITSNSLSISFEFTKLNAMHWRCCLWYVVLIDRHACITRLTFSIALQLACFRQDCNFTYQVINTNSLCMQKENIFCLLIVKLHGGWHPRWDRLVRFQILCIFSHLKRDHDVWRPLFHFPYDLLHVERIWQFLHDVIDDGFDFVFPEIFLKQFRDR